MISKIAPTLLAFYTSFPVPTKEILLQLMRRENWPSNKINMQDKESFVKALSGTRKSRVYDANCRDFAGKCRGIQLKQ